MPRLLKGMQERIGTGMAGGQNDKVVKWREPKKWGGNIMCGKAINRKHARGMIGSFSCLTGTSHRSLLIWNWESGFIFCNFFLLNCHHPCITVIMY